MRISSASRQRTAEAISNGYSSSVLSTISRFVRFLASNPCGHQRSAATIRGHHKVIRRSSGGHQEVIRRSSEVSSEVIRGPAFDEAHRRPSTAPRDLLMRDAIRCNHRPSEAHLRPSTAPRNLLEPSPPVVWGVRAQDAQQQTDLLRRVRELGVDEPDEGRNQAAHQHDDGIAPAGTRIGSRRTARMQAPS